MIVTLLALALAGWMVLAAVVRGGAAVAADRHVGWGTALAAALVGGLLQVGLAAALGVFAPLVGGLLLPLLVSFAAWTGALAVVCRLDGGAACATGLVTTGLAGLVLLAAEAAAAAHSVELLAVVAR